MLAVKSRLTIKQLRTPVTGAMAAVVVPRSSALLRSVLLMSRISLSSSASTSQEKVLRRRKKRELDKLGAWDASWDASSTLPPPIREDLSIARGTIIPEMGVEGVGACSSLGRRNYQEDRFSIKARK